MSWIEKLYETYERCHEAGQFEAEPLMPICHIAQQAHIEVALDSQGKFLRARVLQRGEQTTPIPATEDSASRSSNEAPHALCDKIQYCAKDYAERGGKKKPYFNSYITRLKDWCDSPFGHPKARAVFKYLMRGTLVTDLIAAQVGVAAERGMLADSFASAGQLPPLFRLLQAKQGKRDQGDALVRWRVEQPGEPVSAVWDDKSLQNSWIQFCASRDAARGVCFVTGASDAALAAKHPRGIRFPGDGAKLISSNDNTNFTFRGRFGNAKEACGVGFEVTQKAHNALRWLITRQGGLAKNGDQVIVSWAIGGERIPDPMGNTAELFLEAACETVAGESYAGDAGQEFALRLNKVVAGYGAKLGSTEAVVVMGLDSASPGRMAIAFYRELTGSEFLQRLLDWHSSYAWHQNFSRDLHFVGAPAPRDIAECAYGRGLDDKLLKSTVERLLPCIIDGKSLPRDLLSSAFRRTCNRMGLKSWDWEKSLGIVCGLYRGGRKEETYQMSLEENRTTRDYLFGRLLAIADFTEQRALHIADEKRDTNAARLMQRYADHPCSAWRNIELALAPYKSRLRANRPWQLIKLDKLFDSVIGLFETNDFINDGRLSGEFLLGYHCQRAALWTGVVREKATEDDSLQEGDE
jgi:CRISPR-associated protein Csd1